MQNSTNDSSAIDFDEPSISQRTRPTPNRRSRAGHQYLPQRDEDSPIESQESLSIQAKFFKNKAINLPIFFILCIALIDLPVLFAGVLNYQKQDAFKTNMKSSLKPLQFMSENLKADPIGDIVAGTDGPCPLGYQFLKLGIWPGAAAGCLCDNGDIYRTSCVEVDSPQCKTGFSSLYANNLYDWEGNFWCIKRAVLGTDYIKKAECPPNYKECYPGGCFAYDCPVTSVYSGSYGYVALHRKKGDLPVINAQLTLGETPCDMREAKSYKATVNKEYECDKYGLSQSVRKRLGSKTAYDSYVENAFPYFIMKLTSFVGNESATSTVFSSIARMKTENIDYCQDIDEKAINDFLAVAPNKINLACLALIGVLQLISIISILYNLATSSKTKLFKDPSGLILTLFILNIITFIVAILLLINFAGVYLAFQAAIVYFEEYVSLGCFFGGPGDKVINEYIEMLKPANDGSWIYLALFGSKIVSGWLCFRLYGAEKKESSQKLKKSNGKNKEPVSLKDILGSYS